MTHRAWFMAVGLIVIAGCSEDTPAPLAPGPLPPEIVEVYPPPRSTGIPYESTIWFRFKTPIVPTSVNPTTVFLKIDTKRIPVNFSFSDSNRVVTLRPQLDLELRRTHTIEITTKVRTTEGGKLDQLYYWQFRTTSVRRLEQPLPAAGFATEGPFAPLCWLATESSAGPVAYDIYVSTDSAEVAAGVVTPVHSSIAFVTPPAGRWNFDTRYYWRVHARNTQTGDEADGPVWSFATVAEDTPVEVVRVPLSDSGTWDDRATVRRWRCPDILTGGGLGTILRFNIESLDPNLVVADARLEAGASVIVTDHGPAVYELDQPYVPCDGVSTSMPLANGYLAPGEQQLTGTIYFTSANLISRIQGRIRRQPNMRNYSLKSARSLTFSVPSVNVWISYYRLPPPAPTR
jgi:Bacterial Ig-like domain